MILWFEDIDKKSISNVGGKGANLGEMTRRGFPVPPGFCITVKAYQDHLQKIDLDKKQEVLKSLTGVDRMEEVNRLSQWIQSRILETQLDQELEKAVLTAYGTLQEKNGPSVSVRSSATAEDLPEASFAGQQETFLSVQGETELLEHVKKCWASLWTPRAIAYRQQNGFEHDQVSLSVVVQAMVQSEKAGVLFTVDPVTGSTSDMMINASYGLGESVVSGMITPDTFIVARKGKKLIKDKQLGTKETEILSSRRGMTEEVVVDSDRRNSYSLDEAELHKLRDLGQKVEEHYGYPQDIEWAYKGGELYLLQSRPVTTLGKMNDVKKLSKVQKKILDNFKEHIPDAPYPLDFEPLVQLTEMKNRVFRDLGIGMPDAGKMVLMGPQGEMKLGRIRPFPNLNLFLLPRNIKTMTTGEGQGGTEQLEKRFEEMLHQLNLEKPESLDHSGLALYLQKTIDLAMNWIHLRFSAYVFPMMIVGKQLQRMIKKAGLKESVNQYDFLGGLDYLTAEIESAVYQLTAEISDAPQLKELFLTKDSGSIDKDLDDNREFAPFKIRLEQFLDQYGARTGMAYLPFSAESWNENRSLLFQTIALILKEGNIRQQYEKQERGRQRIVQLKDQVLKNLSPKMGKQFLVLLERFRQTHLGREKLVYRMEQCYLLARRGMIEAAKRLKENGPIGSTVDIRFFTFSELIGLLNGDGDRQKYIHILEERKKRRPQVEAEWKSVPAEEDGKGHLKGLSGSPGTVQGRVRIIHGPEEFGKLEKGEILVCRFTDPVWTPLFTVAGAVVCDTGGPLSHAAIVAREYGMPAVLGVGNGTSRLKDGDLVTVHGSEGIVRISEHS